MKKVVSIFSFGHLKSHFFGTWKQAILPKVTLWSYGPQDIHFLFWWLPSPRLLVPTAHDSVKSSCRLELPKSRNQRLKANSLFQQWRETKGREKRTRDKRTRDKRTRKKDKRKEKKKRWEKKGKLTLAAKTSKSFSLWGFVAVGKFVLIADTRPSSIHASRAKTFLENQD